MTVPPTAAHVAALIARHEAERPRSLQTSVGPSELGTPCTRRLAYRALNLPPVPRPRDILPAQIGTWAHTGMQDVLAGNPEWSTEVDCEIPGYGIPAHVDAYHHPSGSIVDWKFVGDASLRKHRAGMSGQYRTQVHLYGFALAATHGLPVTTVAVCLIPRNGPLTGIHMWTEPYDEGIVETALARWSAVLDLARGLGTAAIPLAPAGADCMWCPWNDPAAAGPPTAAGCPGNQRPDLTPWQPATHEEGAR